MSEVNIGKKIEELQKYHFLSLLSRDDDMYEVVKILSDGVVAINHERYGRQLWSKSKLTKRHKNDACAICGLSVGDTAFRPVTNKGNRYERICTRHFEQG